MLLEYRVNYLRTSLSLCARLPGSSPCKNSYCRAACRTCSTVNSKAGIKWGVNTARVLEILLSAWGVRRGRSSLLPQAVRRSAFRTASLSAPQISPKSDQLSLGQGAIAPPVFPKSGRLSLHQGATDYFHLFMANKLGNTSNSKRASKRVN